MEDNRGKSDFHSGSGYSTYMCHEYSQRGPFYGKPEGSNQQISLHTGNLNRKFLFLFFYHYNISLHYNSGQQKDAEKFCVRSFYSFSTSTLLCTTVFFWDIFWQYQGGVRG